MDRKLALCIPTYQNNFEVLKNSININKDIFSKYDFDIYIYDTSTNNKIESMIKNLNENGYDNIKHVKLDSGMSVDDKMLHIFSGHGRLKKYKYFWPCKDRVFFSESIIKKISKKLDEDSDVIFLDYYEELDNLHIDEIEFYSRYGYSASSLDLTIYKSDFFIRYEWEDFKKRYFFNGTNRFDHFTVLFDTLGKKSGNIAIVSTENGLRNVAGSKASWLEDMIEIFGNLWVKINMKLPEKYNKYKLDTVQKACWLPWIFGSIDSFITLKEYNVFDNEVYEQMPWEYLSPIPLEYLKMVVDERYKELCDIYIMKVNCFLNENKIELAVNVLNGFLKLYSNIYFDEYIIINNIITIYYEEKLNGKRATFFNGVDSLKMAMDKYNNISSLLDKIINDGISKEIVKNTINEQKVSSLCIFKLAVLNYGNNYEKIINKFIDYLQ